MNRTLSFCALALFAMIQDGAKAFVPASTRNTCPTDLMFSKNDVTENRIASGVVALGFLMSSTFGPVVSQADAYDAGDLDVGTSQMLAARSGGRAGGRSSMGGGRSSMRAPSSYSSYRPSSVRSYAPAVPVRPMIAPPIVVSPFGYSPFGYNPLGGFGMGYGLGAMNNIGSEIRDSSQDRRLAEEQAELAATKQREADLEARIKALEQSQTAPAPTKVDVTQ